MSCLHVISIFILDLYFAFRQIQYQAINLSISLCLYLSHLSLSQVGMCLLLHSCNSLLECESMEEVMNIFKNGKTFFLLFVSLNQRVKTDQCRISECVSVIIVTQVLTELFYIAYQSIYFVVLSEYLFIHLATYLSIYLSTQTCPQYYHPAWRI